MKTIYERICAVRNIYSEHFPQGLSILLMLFFLVFAQGENGVDADAEYLGIGLVIQGDIVAGAA